MPELLFNTKLYKGALFLDELIVAGVDPATVWVETAPDGSSCRVTYLDVADEATILSVEATHDAAQLSVSEQLQQVAEDAKGQASAIPGWATWDEATALAWIDANIADANTATALKALARMVIALRNERWPDLQS